MVRKNVNLYGDNRQTRGWSCGQELVIVSLVNFSITDSINQHCFLKPKPCIPFKLHCLQTFTDNVPKRQIKCPDSVLQIVRLNLLFIYCPFTCLPFISVQICFYSYLESYNNTSFIRRCVISTYLFLLYAVRRS